MARMFGTDGIRGTANITPVSPEAVMALGQAVVYILGQAESKQKPVFVVGRDTRLSSPMLEAALTAGLCSAGADVLLAGVMPTPGVAYLTRQVGALGGVVISASHNPYMDNGIKLFASTGSKLEDAAEEMIESYLSHGRVENKPTGGSIGQPSPYREAAQCYITFLKQLYCHGKVSELRIGLDCANGAASLIAPALFEQLGAKVYAWNVEPDGRNINQQCGAVYPPFIQQKVLEYGLDVGFAFDGDADRLLAIDHTGRILDGDYILAICAHVFLRAAQPEHHTVVSTIMANIGLEQTLLSLGFVLHRTSVGDKYVVQGMRQTGAVLGGEQSGHIVFLEHHTTGDGLLTAVQLLNAMVSQQCRLAELAHVLQKFPQCVLNVPIRERRDPLSLPPVKRAVEAATHVLGKDGRVVVRLSGTENVARVMVEGPSVDIVESLTQALGRTIAQELGGEACYP